MVLYLIHSIQTIHSLQYIAWLLIRANAENCSESQRRFDLKVVQNANFHQSILFDSNGAEVYNFRKLYPADGNFEANLCLYNELSYAAVFSHTVQRQRPYTIEYAIDGEVVANTDDLVMTSTNVTSFLLLPSGADAESPMNLNAIYEPMNGTECASDEAQLDVIINETISTVWSTIFDATGQGVALNRNRHCLPKGRH